MVLEIVFRFLVGGVVVCAFAVIGALFQPKTLGGVFGAAPSVALATLGLTFASKGGTVAGIEGRSMIAGAVALALYSLCACVVLRGRLPPVLSTGASGAVWFVVAFGLWGLALR